MFANDDPVRVHLIRAVNSKRNYEIFVVQILLVLEQEAGHLCSYNALARLCSSQIGDFVETLLPDITILYLERNG